MKKLLLLLIICTSILSFGQKKGKIPVASCSVCGLAFDTTYPTATLAYVGVNKKKGGFLIPLVLFEFDIHYKEGPQTFTSYRSEEPVSIEAYSMFLRDTTENMEIPEHWVPNTIQRDEKYGYKIVNAAQQYEPVTGISYEGAQAFLSWFTRLSETFRKAEGLPTFPATRLPKSYEMDAILTEEELPGLKFFTGVYFYEDQIQSRNKQETTPMQPQETAVDTGFYLVITNEDPEEGQF